MKNESKRLQIEKATIADDEQNEIIKIMTPQEKANELVNKYFLEIEGADRYAFNLPSMNLYIAKQCALIAVDEIIQMSDINKIVYSFYVTQYTEDFYWKKVKQEIEKL